MNLWRQYNPDRLLGAVLSEHTGLPLTQCSEKALFEALKRHLTRKELRCWVMAESGMSAEAIVEAMGFEPDEVEKSLEKAKKKLRQPKMQQEFRTQLLQVGDEDE